MAKKKIKILTTGAIRVKGFINGPVLTPYMEDTATIFAMVSQGVKVVEVCNDGSEVRLTTSNFADDNNKVIDEVKMTESVKENTDVIMNEEVSETKEEVKEIVEETEATEFVVEEKNEEVIEPEVIPEVKEDVKVEPEKVQVPKSSYQNNYKNNNYNNKHNKHNKNNNYRNNNVVRVESADSIKIGN